MRRVFAPVLARAHGWAAVTLTESYLRIPSALKKSIERRGFHAPHENVSAVLWLSGAQEWARSGLEDNLSVAAWLLFLACGVAGTWLGRRWFG